MSNNAEHAVSERSKAPPARFPAENVESPAQRDSTLSGEITALRDDAATLEFIARRWARLLPAHRTDVRIDIARLREIAGNARGFARTMEDAT